MGAEELNDNISTALYTAAFEKPMPEVDAYLCGERSGLRSMPQVTIGLLWHLCREF